MYQQLAWRNIWRNPRRTAVILTAVVIGVWSMIFLGAIMQGFVVEMIKNGIATLTGHIQVHQKGYRSDPVVENSIRDPNFVDSALKQHLSPGAELVHRVRVNAIANNARHSSGVTLVGIDPVQEAKVSFIGQAIREGQYFSPGDKNGIIVGKALLDKFETKLGKKLILMSQDTKGEIASRSFRIIGVFRAAIEATEKQFVFVQKLSAQEMLKLGEGISEVSVLLPDEQKINQITAELRNALSAAGYEVHPWKELLPFLSAYLDINREFVFIWYIVVFIAMGFGIVNTTLMAVFERMKEFGLLKALGMKPWGIIKGVLLESFFLLLIGMGTGNILSLLTSYALSFHGIDLSAFAAGMEFWGMSRIIYPVILIQDLITANLVVLVLGLVVSLYPALKAARFTPLEALEHT